MPDPSRSSNAALLDAGAADFYRSVMRQLTKARLPFLVGGAYALRNYTGIERHTKDFDIFVIPEDARRCLTLISPLADRTDLRYPHWLGKAYSGEHVVDIIFGSGNGTCPVDSAWFEHAQEHEVLGRPVKLVPPEEMIWQKAFVMERHRFDGGDVIHLLDSCGESLDWNRLLSRFGKNWMVLFAHLILYRFAYPSHSQPRMAMIIERLVARAAAECNLPDEMSCDDAPLCRGTLLSLLDYLSDVQDGSHFDARLEPLGKMTPEDIAHWTATFER